MARRVMESVLQLEKAFTAGTASMQYWLDTETGKIEVILGDMAGEPEMVALTERLVAEPERFLRIPQVDAREEYRLMLDFAKALPDSTDKTALQAALVQRGGTQRFNKTLNSNFPRLRHQWDARHKEWLNNRIQNWLKAHDLEMAEQ